MKLCVHGLYMEDTGLPRLESISAAFQSIYLLVISYGLPVKSNPTNPLT